MSLGPGPRKGLFQHGGTGTRKQFGRCKEEVAGVYGKEAGGFRNRTTAAGRGNTKGEEGSEGTEGASTAAETIAFPRSQDDRSRDDEEPGTAKGHNDLRRITSARGQRVNSHWNPARVGGEEGHHKSRRIQRARGLESSSTKHFNEVTSCGTEQQFETLLGDWKANHPQLSTKEIVQLMKYVGRRDLRPG